MVGLLIAIAAVVAACVGLLVGLNVGASRRINNLRKSAYEDFDKQLAELAQRAQARESEHAAAVVAAQRDLGAVHREAAEARKQADAQAVQIREQAAAAAAVEMDRARRIRDEAETETRVLKDEIRELRLDLERREARQAEREERLDADLRRTADKERELAAADADLERKRAELATLEDERRAVLERAAALSSAEAKTELVKSIENQAKREAAVLIRQIEQEARDEGDKRARKTVALAIQRVASEQTAESVVSVLHLPSDDMKGRIIGREGRNIRAYESITGVNLIIDDS
ncbi:MAG: DUF3552 domain-containing protein, partial [Catenulispora sp.]|nr:DUF3552 domain-containing protein [Catenulispora sp.]